MEWPARRFPIPKGPDAVRVNLGCGLDYRDGWVNADWNPDGTLRVDREFNLEELPWPFDASSVDYVLMSHLVEHIRHGLLYGVTRKSLALIREAIASGKWDEERAKAVEDLAAKDGLIAVFEELHRVLKPGGVVDVLTPGTGTPDTWRDPTHTRGMEPDFWTYFSDRAPASRQFYTPARFRYVRQHHIRTLNYRAPFRWLGLTDYHFDRYAAPVAGLVKRFGVRKWHLTRLEAVK